MSALCFRQLLVVALFFLCPFGNLLPGQSPFVNHYFNPSPESDHFVKYSFNSAINGTSDNSYRIISAGVKVSSGFNDAYLELCFLKEDGTGRSINPMKEVPLLISGSNDPRIIQIISNSLGHFIFMRLGGDNDKLIYSHLNANGDLLSTHELFFAVSNPSTGKIQINQVIPGPVNTVAMVGTISVNNGSNPDRVFFAIVNILTHSLVVQRQYMIDADLAGGESQEEYLYGLSLLRFGTTGYFIAGHSGEEYGGQPFLMRVGTDGGFMWFRNWQFEPDGVLGTGLFNNAKALPNMRLFSANDGAGGTYYGLIYGDLGQSLHLIRFNPNVISGSGIWDNRLITGLPPAVFGDSYLTAVYSGFSFPKLVGTHVSQLNSNGDYNTAFFSYNLLTNTGNVYTMFNLPSSTSTINHCFARNIIGGKPNLSNNTVQLFIGNEVQDPSFTTAGPHHLFAKTEAIGAGPSEFFGCHAGSQLVSEHPDNLLNFNMGIPIGVSNYALSFGSRTISSSSPIPFTLNTYCSGSGFRVGETTDRDQFLKDTPESRQDLDAESARVKIYNIAGQLICEGANLTTAGCRELLRDQPSGIYLMERVTATGEMSVEKVFHQKQ